MNIQPSYTMEFLTLKIYSRYYLFALKHEKTVSTANFESSEF